MKSLSTVTWVVGGLVAVALGAACGAPDPEMPTRVMALTGTAANGTDVYERKCAGCHGADGEGTSSPLSQLVPAQSDESLARVVSGGGHVSQDGMTDQEAADLIAYLRAMWPG